MCLGQFLRIVGFLLIRGDVILLDALVLISFSKRDNSF